LCVALVVLAPAAMTTACSDDSSEHKGTGSIAITGTVASALNGAGIDHIVVHALRTDDPSNPYTTDIQLTNVNGIWSGGAAGLPAGTYQLMGDAFQGAVEMYMARADMVPVVANQTATVNLNFHAMQPGNPFQNSAPYITAISAGSRTVQVGQTITVSATAIDADNDPLTYTWSLPGTPVETGQSVQWTASGPGTFSLSVSVSDGRGGTSVGAITITVAAPQQNGSLAITAQFFDAPVINTIGLFDMATNSENAQPSPGDNVNIELAVSGGSPVCPPPPADGLCIGGGGPNLNISGTCIQPFSVPFLPGPMMMYPTVISGTPGQACSINVMVRDAAGAMSMGTFNFHLAQPL
jgi:hypothetical protein